MLRVRGQTAAFTAFVDTLRDDPIPCTHKYDDDFWNRNLVEKSRVIRQC